MQTSMEAKLQELYGNYKKYDNGIYEVKLKTGNVMFIPETIDTNQSMIAYAPGSGGFSNSYQRFKELYSTDNPPNCVTVMSYESYDHNNILNIGTDAINNLGGQVDNVVYASFSLSGITGIKKTENYLKENPNVSMSIISCDGCEMYNGLKDEYPTVKETETPFIMLSHGLKYKYVYEKMLQNGYNTYYLTVNNKDRGSHSQQNKDMINYLLQYAVGDLDEIPENDVNYLLYKDDYNQPVDIENIRCDGAGNILGYDKNKYKSILKLDALSFTGLENYSDTDKIGNGYIKADFEFLQTTINQIRSSISKANIATKTPTLPIAGAGGLASAIAACVEKYTSMTVNLYSKLAQETKATQSYGQSIINLDQQQKNNLSNINDTVTLGNTDNNIGTLGALGALNGATQTTKTTTPSTAPYQPQSSSPTPTQSTPNTNPTGSTGSAGSTGSTGTTSSTGSTGSKGTTPSTQEVPSNTNPITNGNMTWNYKDGHKLTLTLENGKITSMKFSYTYNSVDELNKNINNFLSGKIDKQYFDKMIITDRTVEVTIKQSYFNNLSMAQIQNLYFK